jgi:hypothetical protein
MTALTTKIANQLVNEFPTMFSGVTATSQGVWLNYNSRKAIEVCQILEAKFGKTKPASKSSKAKENVCFSADSASVTVRFIY